MSTLFIVTLLLMSVNSQAALKASQANDNSVILTWTAVGDDGHFGTATMYDIRFATFPITEQNWNSATQVDSVPKPSPAGSKDSCAIYNLMDDATYYFAVKTGDEVPNWSGISNVVSVTFVPAPIYPEAAFAADINSGFAPLSVAFTDISTGNPVSCVWDFGDNSTSTELNPTHVYQNPGMYTVSLTITNNDGSDDTTIVDYINVLEELNNTASNLFTSGETAVSGEVSGSYQNTHNEDGVYQIIRESESGGKPSRRHSRLEHRWQFVLDQNPSYIFNVKAFRNNNTDNDDFMFEYSYDNNTFIPLLTVNGDVNGFYSAILPDDSRDTVYIRVVDTDKSPGNLSFDQLFVDYMYIESGIEIIYSDTIFVHSIEVTRESSKGNKVRGTAKVTIHDRQGMPVVGAMVTGHFSGETSDFVSAYTGVDGSALLESSTKRNPISGWTFTVDNVSLQGIVYSPFYNNMSSAVESPSASPMINVPKSFALAQNYPNPFNPTTTISFDIPKAENVKIDVINILGQIVTTLVDEKYEAGSHSIEWDTRSSSGSKVGSGVYFYRLQAGEFSDAKKMVLMK